MDKTSLMIIKDHKKKSYEVRYLRKLLKKSKTESVNKKALVEYLKSQINTIKDVRFDYEYDCYDKASYDRDSGRNSGRVEELESLIYALENGYLK